MRTALLAALVLGLAACSGGLGVPVASAGPNTALPAPRPDAVVDVDTPPGTALDGFVGAREDVTLERCEPGAGWTASGTVTNPGSTAASYRVYVSVLDGEGTVGLGEVRVADLAGGATEPWQLDLDVAGEGFECVLRVERATR